MEEAEVGALAHDAAAMAWECEVGGGNMRWGPSWHHYVGTGVRTAAVDTWLGHVHPADRGQLHDAWRDAVCSADGSGLDVEARVRAGDGRYRRCRFRGWPVSDAGGAVSGWAGTCGVIDEDEDVDAGAGRAGAARSATSRPASRYPAGAGRARAIDLIWAVGGASAGMGGRALLTPLLGEQLEFVLAFCAVAVVASVRGFLAGLSTAVLCALWAIVPWLPPPTVDGRQGAIGLGLFLASSVVVATLAGRGRGRIPGDDAAPFVPLPARSTALLWAAGVLPVAFCAYVGWATYQDAIAAAYPRLERTIAVAAEQLNRVIDTNQVIARSLLQEVGDASDAQLRADEVRLQGYVLGVSAGLEQIQSIWLWDSAGRPLVSSVVYPSPSSLSVADRAYFRAHRDDGADSFVSHPLASRTTGERFFGLSHRREVAGAFAGVVSVSLRPEYFERFFGRLGRSEPGLTIGLLHADGIVISRWPEIAGTRDWLVETEELRGRMHAGSTQGTLRIRSPVDDHVRHTAYARVEAYPLYIAAALDREALLASWYRDLAVLAVVVLPASIGLVWLLFIAFERSERVRVAYAHAREQAEQRTRAEDALRHAQKLEALGSLTGGVAHDFNNLLAVVSNSVYLLKHMHARRGGSPEESAPIAAITRAVEAGTKLTRQLLAFSRRQPLAPEVVQVAEVLAAMKDLLHTIVSRRIELETKVPPDLPLVKVDPAELELAVINLVVNSRDAVRSRGRIDISGDVWQNPSTAQAFVRIAVKDNGSGIAPALMERVFDPFFTTKPRGAGTGLGLSQVYGFCTQAGGTVRIESTPGAGTTVTMYLPVTRDDRPGEAQTEAEPARVSGHVLLVEDNADIGSTMREVLRSLGASVTCVRSGDEALMLLGQRGESVERFDVVVSDVVMPGRISGIQLAKRLRRRKPNLPVVLMTGYTSELQAAVTDGFTVLSKPVAPLTLARVLARMQSQTRTQTRTR